MDDIERMERENDRMKKEVEGYKKKIRMQELFIDAWSKSYFNAASNNWRLANAVKEALEMIERKGGWVQRSAVEDVVCERVVGTMKEALVQWDGESVEHAIEILNKYHFYAIGSETIGKRPGAVARSPRGRSPRGRSTQKPVAKKRKEVTVMKIEKCCGGKKKGCKGGKGK